MPAVGRARPESRTRFAFEGRRYDVGESYGFDELPSAVRRDLMAQEEDLEARFQRRPEDLSYRLILVPHEALVRALMERHGADFESAAAAPEVKSLARSIQRHGLLHPPVGEEGRKRALALAALGMDMPYFEIVEPMEEPAPALLEIAGEPAEKEGELPEPMAKEMREGFWRMMQRVSLGIPGFVGTGEIHGEEGGLQFVGGLAGTRTAWLLRPHGMRLFETVPIVGFYLMGEMWPKVIRLARITRGKSDNWSKVAERLEKEFGRTTDPELMRGTVPFPQPGPSLGADPGPTRVKPWARCGNTMFWRWTYDPESVERPLTVHVNPVDFAEIQVHGEPEGLPEGAMLLVQRTIADGIPHGWSSQELHEAMGRISTLLSGAVAVWLTLLSQMESAGAVRADMLGAFVRTTQARRNAVLTGLEELFASGALTMAERRRLIVLEGSPAHQALAEAEAAGKITDPSVVARNFEIQAVVDEALSSYGIVEC